MLRSSGGSEKRLDSRWPVGALFAVVSKRIRISFGRCILRNLLEDSGLA